MIEHYVSLFKKWYEYRLTRERFLLLILSWSALYAIFYLALYRHITNEKNDQLTEITSIRNENTNWQTQIDALNKISSTPLYKEWLDQRQTFRNLEDKYKSLLQPFSKDKWQETMDSILQTPPNVTLLQVKNSADSIYSPAGATDFNSKIYQQQVTIVISGNFFDMLNYLQKLEKQLTIVHWDTFHLQTQTYPLEKIEMEFSIFYD